MSRRNVSRQRIVEVVSTNPGKTAPQIVALLGQKKSYVSSLRYHLGELERYDFVRKETKNKGGWAKWYPGVIRFEQSEPNHGQSEPNMVYGCYPIAAVTI